MLSRRGEFGFVWLFAIFAGVAILILSIYGAMQFGERQRYETDSTIAKKLSILTDPLEAGFTDTTFGTIEFRQETKIRNICSEGGFGHNSIAAATRSDVGEEFLDYGASTSIKQKYIFGREDASGKTFYVLSKAFSYPYKFGDFVLLVSGDKKYCFVDSPDHVVREIESLKIPFVSLKNCSGDVDFVQVCFGRQDCDVNIKGNCESCENLFETGVVREDGEKREYVGNLLYPAIFSDEIVYECVVRRLLYKGSVASKVLSSKAAIMNARLSECNTNFEPILEEWGAFLANASINDVVRRYPESVKMDEMSRWEVCSVW